MVYYHQKEITMSLAIEVKNLSKSFGDKQVLKDVNIQVEEKSVYGFLGNNGAGKSTLIRLLLGLLNIDDGIIKINGETISRADTDYKATIGCLIDSPCFYSQLSPKQFLGISCKIKNLAQIEIGKALEIVNMSAHLNVPMETFSLGMKQRVALASALIGEPKLLILDEPTNGLDPAGMKEIRKLIRTLPERSNTTVFLSSHLLDEIEKTATHVGILNQGRMMVESSLVDLLQKSKTSLDLITSDPEKLKRFFANKNTASEIISADLLRIEGVSYEQCADVNKQVIEADFNLIESRFNQVSLESLFLKLVEPNAEGVK